MKIDLKIYGCPLMNNVDITHYDVNINEIASIQADVDMVFVKMLNGHTDRFRFTNRRFSDLFKRRLENGY